MRVLALVTDAFGGRGGIAEHNRQMLAALCSAPGVEEVTAIPRLLVHAPGTLPERLTYVTDAAGSKPRFARHLARTALAARRGAFDVVVNGHLNLLPAAAVAARRHGARLIQVVHGIEAWPDPGPLRRRLIRTVDTLVSVSDFTRQRVLAWAEIPARRTTVIPNAIDLARYGPGPKRPDLLARYGLAGTKVILTVGRISASERYKGHDAILELLPGLATEIPHVAYLVVGDGDDRPRLEAKARALGVTARVVFAGFVPEDEKADHYRLADVFAMPGRGEGFGIVYLEALACGTPVVASSADASREAVLDGVLGAVVDPDDPAALRGGIIDALSRPRSPDAGALAGFDVPAFRRRWQATLAGVPSTAYPALAAAYA